MALDGAKIKANASKHKAMSYERLAKGVAELDAEVAKWKRRTRRTASSRATTRKRRFDATAQVIVAHALDARQNDQHQLTPMSDVIEANLGRKPEQLSADAGYCSNANLAALEERGVDAYIAPERAKHASEGEGGGARIQAMRETIAAGGHESPYRLR